MISFITTYLTAGAAIVLYLLIFRMDKINIAAEELIKSKKYQEINQENFYETGYELNPYFVVKVLLLTLIFIYPYIIYLAIKKKIIR